MKIETKFSKKDKVFFIWDINDAVPSIKKGVIEDVQFSFGTAKYNINGRVMFRDVYEGVEEMFVFATKEEALQCISNEFKRRLEKAK